MNTMTSETKAPESYKVGDGVTYSINGDSYPATVRKVSPSGHQVWVSQDEFRASPSAKAHDENATPGVFIPRDIPEADWKLFTRRPSGRYLKAGTNYMFLSAGRTYRSDPTF